MRELTSAAITCHDYNSRVMTRENASAPLFSGDSAQGAIGIVAVDRAIDRVLSYRIDPHWMPLAKPGMRVHVPLGRANKLVDGVLIKVILPAEYTPALVSKAWKLKSISHIDDHHAPLSTDLMQLAKWTSQYYVCPLGLVLASMIPAAAKRQAALPTREILLLATDAQSRMETPGLSRQAKAAFDRLQTVITDHMETTLDLKIALKTAGVSPLLLRRLIAHGVVVRKKLKLLPNPAGGKGLAVAEGEILTGPVLTNEQMAAWQQIEPLLERDAFCVRLLYGITGSGKTELYLRALERVIARGKRGIVLIPDISLTTHMVDRFIKRFDRIVVLHSGMSESTRHQHWQAAASGWANVIMGPRSAVFAPVPDCGLIVVDEEHDTSFKQDNAPRYHARDVAIRRAQLLRIPVLLGSATPSLESWHNSETLGHFNRIELLSRPSGVQLPHVVLVDMHAERRQVKAPRSISRRLESEMESALHLGRQVILLLNRRGWSHYTGCSRCEWALNCEHCDAHMVVHRHRPAGHQVRRYVQCHYCLTSCVMPTLCPACGGKLIGLGQGTQQVYEELLERFPKNQAARMDGDSMRNLNDYRQILSDFENGKIQILLGTQMVAKGLDFADVGLVGVIDADAAQSSPDFRATERTFDMVCQVAGRCGRRQNPGRVVVQTADIRSAAIGYAAHHDYVGFVTNELSHRKAFGYPPYSRMARLLISHKDREHAVALGRRLAGVLIPLAQSDGCRWQGPQNPPMEFRDDLFRIELIVFGSGAAQVQQVLGNLRREPIFEELGRWLTVDMDPINLR
jgi:primosomal protein N' (replication factor Y)